MLLFAATLSAKLGESDKITWDMAKQIIQSQYDMSMYGITTIIALALILMTASFVLNIYLNNQKLESLKKEIKSVWESDLKTHSDALKNEAEKIKKDLAETALKSEADTARAFTLICEQSKGWESAIGWALGAVVAYHKLGDEERKILV